MSTLIYTIGSTKLYDSGLKNHIGKFFKQGMTPSYPGGFAVKTIQDGKQLIEEMGEKESWAVYEIEAKWGVDTKKSENGWWHLLLKDARIKRRVSYPV